MTKRTRSLLVSLVAFVLLAACGAKPAPAPAPQPPAGGNTPASPATPAQRGSLVFGWPEIMQNFDPQYAVAPPNLIPYSAYADALLRWDPKTGNLQAALATEWKRIDANTIEVKLRQGVKFQNGEDFDSASVAYSFKRARNPDLKLPLTARVRNFKDVQIVDKYTARIVTDGPDALLERKLALVNMVPSKYLEQVGEKEWELHPIGTGPFKLTGAVPSQEFTLEAWDQSWRGAPKLQKITFKAIPDVAARISTLMAGGVDIAYGVTPDQLDKLKKAGFTVTTNLTGRVYEIQMKWVDCNCPLQDPRVRQAMQYAIDKETMVKDLFLGLTTEAPGQHFFPFTFGNNPNVKAYPYDPKKAKQLLADAGYPNGFTLKFETTNGREMLDKTVSETIASYLKDVGIKTDMEVIDYATYLARFANPKIRSDLHLGFWAYVPLLDADLVLNWYQCGVANKWHCDPAFDQVYKQSLAELDPAKRLPLLQQAVQLVHDNPPDIFLFGVPDIYALSPKVGGFEPRPDSLINFDALSKK